MVSTLELLGILVEIFLSVIYLISKCDFSISNDIWGVSYTGDSVLLINTWVNNVLQAAFYSLIFFF